MAGDFGNIDERFWAYVAQNAAADTLKLMLKSEPDLPFDKRLAVMQIECRKKAKNKIPELLENEHFLFPKAISAEQCTHQDVAKFHAEQFLPTDNVLDMTMGLGVDSHYISQKVASLTAIELDEEIAAAGAYNHAFTVLHADSEEYLKSTSEHFEAIFIDPARRGEGGSRLYGLADCAPDVLTLLPAIKSHANRLYIKASPMIDVTQSLKDLHPWVTDVWAVSVKNECKELFFRLDFVAEKRAEVLLHAINFDKNRQQFTVPLSAMHPEVSYAAPEVGQCLYEPNASVMKIGAYAALSAQYPVKKIAQNSHLYVSETPAQDFPGRQFVVDAIIPFKDKEIKAIGKQYKQLNVATRNFRLTADALKKRLKVRDGGAVYLFATTLADESQVLIFTHKA